MLPSCCWLAIDPWHGIACSLQVVPPKSCSLCVVVGGGSRPPGLPRGARCLREEWLFHAAERFEQPAMEEYEL